MTCVLMRVCVRVWEVAARVAVARVAAARAAAGRWRRCLGDEGGVCLGVCVACTRAALVGVGDGGGDGVGRAL